MSHSAVVREWRSRERELTRLGHDVHLLTARVWNEGGRAVAAEPEPGEQVTPVRTWGTHPALFVYDPIPLWRALGEGWDVVDIHEEPFALVTAEILLLRALRRQRAPYVLYSAQNLEKRYPVPFRWLERWALRHASGVAVCNREAGWIVERKGFPGTARYVPLGVDLGRYRHVPRPPRNGGELIHVGFLGRIEERKGVDVLLDAVEGDPHLRLTLVGGGSLEGRARSRAAQVPDGRVTVLGAVPEHRVSELLASFDVVAVPSLTTPSWVEQFGRVAVEAMAAGVPVVASDSGALPDVVGDAGLVVPEGDAVALAHALSCVGSDASLADDLRRRGLDLARQCSWSEVARKYDTVYRLATHTANPKEPAGLHVIVVAYGSPALLRRCLEPITDLPVTVVDNSSLPEIRDLCQELGIRYLDPGRNGGFGAGVNHALGRLELRDTDVLLLNPDAVVSVDGVHALHTALRRDPLLASVAPSQVDGQGRRARVTWPFPTPWGSWLEAAGLGRLNDRTAGYVIGSVLMLRAEAVCHVGRFDEDFFLYAEETDWARRASLLGWRHREVVSVLAQHEGAATSSNSSQRQAHFYAGQERYFRKHFGDTGWQMARAGQIAGALARRRLLTGARADAAREKLSTLRRGPMAVESLNAQVAER